jgi:hypothetical protein
VGRIVQAMLMSMRAFIIICMEEGGQFNQDEWQNAVKG